MKKILLIATLISFSTFLLKTAEAPFDEKDGVDALFSIVAKEANQKVKNDLIETLRDRLKFLRKEELDIKRSVEKLHPDLLPTYLARCPKESELLRETLLNRLHELDSITIAAADAIRAGNLPALITCLKQGTNRNLCFYEKSCPMDLLMLAASKETKACVPALATLLEHDYSINRTTAIGPLHPKVGQRRFVFGPLMSALLGANKPALTFLLKQEKCKVPKDLVSDFVRFTAFAKYEDNMEIATTQTKEIVQFFISLRRPFLRHS